MGGMPGMGGMGGGSFRRQPMEPQKVEVSAGGVMCRGLAPDATRAAAMQLPGWSSCPLQPLPYADRLKPWQRGEGAAERRTSPAAALQPPACRVAMQRQRQPALPALPAPVALSTASPAPAVGQAGPTLINLSLSLSHTHTHTHTHTSVCTRPLPHPYRRYRWRSPWRSCTAAAPSGARSPATSWTAPAARRYRWRRRWRYP